MGGIFKEAPVSRATLIVHWTGWRLENESPTLFFGTLSTTSYSIEEWDLWIKPSSRGKKRKIHIIPNESKEPLEAIGTKQIAFVSSSETCLCSTNLAISTSLTDAARWYGIIVILVLFKQETQKTDDVWYTSNRECYYRYEHNFNHNEKSTN